MKLIKEIDVLVDDEINEKEFIEGYNIGWEIGYHGVEQHIVSSKLSNSFFQGLKVGEYQGHQDS